MFRTNKVIPAFCLVLLFALALCYGVPSRASADTADIIGQWYGTWVGDYPVGRWASPEFPTGAVFEMFNVQDGAGYYWAMLYIPEIGLFDTPLPMAFMGDQIAVGDPPFAWGTVAGDFISGYAVIQDPLPPYFYTLALQAQRPIDPLPGPAPGPECNELQPPYCVGSAEYCSELLPFSPAIGPGHIDYLVLDETWEDQYRSWIRRDLMQLVQYAAAKVHCKTAGWDYGNFSPVGLGDMSEPDGSAPRYIGHRTHEDGRHIDIAYYQLYAEDNLLRNVCRRTLEGYHCAELPYALDVWRTGLFMANLAEHPLLGGITVDGLVGITMEAALDDLVASGWAEPGLRAAIPMVYGPQISLRSHYDHMHASMKRLHPIVSGVALHPETLHTRSKGKYFTGYIELVEGYDPAGIDISTVALIVNGFTILYAEPGQAEVSDYNENGVPDLTVKFDRRMVLQAIGAGTVEMAVIGSVDGMFFQASDTILAISP